MLAWRRACTWKILNLSYEYDQELHLNLELKFMAQAHLWFTLILTLCKRKTQNETLVILDADCIIYPVPYKLSLWKLSLTDLPQGCPDWKQWPEKRYFIFQSVTMTEKKKRKNFCKQNWDNETMKNNLCHLKKNKSCQINLTILVTGITILMYEGNRPDVTKL